jgi:hypothetical protein
MKRLRHPVRSIREPFGTAGLIVACVALILALTGAAFAATGLNGKQKKEVEKIAKKLAGKPGANGTNGTNGANGSPGAKGDKGDPGAQGNPGTPGVAGKSVVLTAEAAGLNCKEGGTKVEVEGNAASKKYVCNGLTGFTETLPSDETETGSWSQSVTARGEIIPTVPISFSIPLVAAGGPGSAIGLTKEETDLGSSTTCTGTAANPTAPPGKLCVYTGFEEALGNAVGFRELQSPDAQEGKYGATGAVLQIGSLEGTKEESAKLEAWGSWAVTAP